MSDRPKQANFGENTRRYWNFGGLTTVTAISLCGSIKVNTSTKLQPGHSQPAANQGNFAASLSQGYFMQKYHSEVTVIDSVIIASFAGEITTNNYSSFRNDYNEICRLLSMAEDKRLLIDLTETTFFGSLFIGIIMKLAVQIGRKEGLMALSGLSPHLNQLMDQLLLLERQPIGGFQLECHLTRQESLAFLNGCSVNAVSL